MENINKEKVQEYFDTHPKVNSFWFSTDGMAFIREDQAISHQNEVDSKKEPKQYKRSDLKSFDKTETTDKTEKKYFISSDRVVFEEEDKVRSYQEGIDPDSDYDTFTKKELEELGEEELLNQITE
jgi:hypothetical protein